MDLKYLASQGFCLHPLYPNGKVPVLPEWPKVATNSPEEIRSLEIQHPNHNWGIATGKKSGIVVVDIDPRNGGNKTWAALGTMPQTVCVATPNDGVHMYYRYPPNGLRSTKLEGIDIQSDGKQVVAPGSAIDGRQYRWINSPDDCAIEDLPDALMALLAPKPIVVAPAPVVPAKPQSFAHRLFWAKVFEKYPNTIDGLKSALGAAGFPILGEEPDGVFVQSPNASQYTTPALITDVKVFIGFGFSAFHSHDAGLWTDAEDFVRRYLPGVWADYETALENSKGVDTNWSQYDETPAVEPKKSELIYTDWETVSGDVEWFWDGKIPFEGTTLVAGEGGIGKSQALLSIAASCSTGGLLPDGATAPLGDVLLFTAEDPDKVVKSRLVRLGADLKRIHKIDGRKSGTKEKYFDLKDVATIQTALKMWPETKLVIIDPVASYVEGIDTHKNAEVRSVLKPITKLAEEHKLAVCLVVHLNKDENKSASSRISGSNAWRDNARAVWFVVKDKKDETRRYFMPDKNNYAPLGNGFIYGVEDGMIRWAGETTAKLHELMGYEAPVRKSDAAEQWLRERLKSGEVQQSTIFEDGLKLGFTEFTLRTAKNNIGVESKKSHFSGPWVWAITCQKTSSKTESDDDRPF